MKAVRSAGSVGAALAACLVLVGCGSYSAGPTAANGLPPSVTASASSVPPPSSQTSPPPSGTIGSPSSSPGAVPACTTNDLKPGLGVANLSANHVVAGTTLENVGSSACSVQGFPQFVTDRGGQSVTDDVAHGLASVSPLNIPLVPVVLKPHRSAEFLLAGRPPLSAPSSCTGNGCEALLSVQLPGIGGSILMPNADVDLALDRELQVTPLFPSSQAQALLSTHLTGSPTGPAPGPGLSEGAPTPTS